MNKTFKRIVSVILALVMLMAFAAVAVATDGGAQPEEEHRFLFQVIWEGICSFWELIRYVFYDVFLGVAP